MGRRGWALLEYLAVVAGVLVVLMGFRTQIDGAVRRVAGRMQAMVQPTGAPATADGILVY